MIQKIDVKQDNVLAFRIKGKLDIDSFVQASHDLSEELSQNKHFSVLLEIEEPKGVDFGVVWKSMRYSMAHLRQYLRQIDRIAIITDKKWLHRAAAFENLVLVGIREKAFKSSQKDAAIHWVAKQNGQVAA